MSTTEVMLNGGGKYKVAVEDRKMEASGGTTILMRVATVEMSGEVTLTFDSKEGLTELINSMTKAAMDYVGQDRK